MPSPNAPLIAIVMSFTLLSTSANCHADEIPIGVTTSVTLQCDATVERTIQGTEGDYLLISVCEDQDLGGGGSCPACCCFDFRARLFTPSGTLIAERATGVQGNCCSCRSRRTMAVWLPETGEYTLELRDQDLNGRGILAVTAQRLNDPVNASALTPGASIIFQLDTPGRFETTRIEVEPGTPIAVAMTVESGNVEPVLSLYDGANGQLVAFSTTGEVNAVASAGGLILASHSDTDETGVYRLTLEPESICADLTGDGLVNVLDLLVILNSWGACE